jgi:hypothetical protein
VADRQIQHPREKRRTIERLIKFAREDDPEAAAEEERARDRARKKAKRRPPESDDFRRDTDVVEFPQKESQVEHIFGLIESLNDQEREDLRQLCKEKWSWERRSPDRHAHAPNGSGGPCDGQLALKGVSHTRGH